MDKINSCNETERLSSWWFAQPGDKIKVKTLTGEFEDYVLEEHTTRRMRPVSTLSQTGIEGSRPLTEKGTKKYDTIIGKISGKSGTGKPYEVGRGVPLPIVEDILQNPRSIAPSRDKLVYEAGYFIQYRRNYRQLEEAISTGDWKFGEAPIKVIVDENRKVVVTVLT